MKSAKMIAQAFLAAAAVLICSGALAVEIQDIIAAEERRTKTEVVKQRDGMVYIPAGAFWFGCSRGDKLCWEDEQPRVKVYLDGFWIDKYEVTQARYSRLAGENPSFFRYRTDQHPVERVTWYEARDYCHALGKRLPTEAEWEKAARGGMEVPAYWGVNPSGDLAWYWDYPNVKTDPVGRRQSNAYGIHDMPGNVREWVEDCYDRDWYRRLHGGQINPVNWCVPSGAERVLRGGMWDLDARYLRVSVRYSSHPNDEFERHGFRCARDR